MGAFPPAAQQSQIDVGLVGFVAAMGLADGPAAPAAIQGHGFMLMAVGVVVTLTPLMVGTLCAHRILRMKATCGSGGHWPDHCQPTCEGSIGGKSSLRGFLGKVLLHVLDPRLQQTHERIGVREHRGLQPQRMKLAHRFDQAFVGPGVDQGCMNVR